MSQSSRSAGLFAFRIMIMLIVPLTSCAAVQDGSDSVVPRIIRVSPGTLEKSALTRKNPTLPPIPKDLNIETTAILELSLDQSGRVLNARPIYMHPRLQKHAIEAAREWKFQPQTENGNPVFALGTIALNFASPNPVPESADIEKARAAIEQEPDNPVRYVELATLLELAERYEDAIAELSRPIPAKPDAEEAVLALARIYGKLEQFDRQIEQYEKYLELQPDSAEALQLLGRAYIEHKKFGEAIDVLNRLLRLKPNDAAVRSAIGQAYSAQHQYEKAIRTYRTALTITPDSAKLHSLLGQELLRIRELKAAETELNRAISLDPDLLTPYRYLATMYLSVGRNREAGELLKKAISEIPTDLRDLYDDFGLLGLCSTQMKNYDEAAAYFKQAIEIDPEKDAAYCGLGGVHGQQKNTELAYEAHEKGLQFSPNSYCLHVGIGYLLTKMNRNNESEVHLRKAQSLAPDRPETYIALVELMKKKQDWKEAILLSERALEIAPADNRLRLMLGYSYDQGGRIDEAERELRDALRFEPESPLV